MHKGEALKQFHANLSALTAAWFSTVEISQGLRASKRVAFHTLLPAEFERWNDTTCDGFNAI